MNLKEVYEIFYPGKCEKLPSVWKVPPKYRSKKSYVDHEKCRGYAMGESVL